MFVMWVLVFCHWFGLGGRVMRRFASAVRHVWWVCGIVKCRFDVDDLVIVAVMAT